MIRETFHSEFVSVCASSVKLGAIAAGILAYGYLIFLFMANRTLQVHGLPAISARLELEMTTRLALLTGGSIAGLLICGWTVLRMVALVLRPDSER